MDEFKKEEVNHLDQFIEDINIINNEMTDIDKVYDTVSQIFFSVVKDPTRIDIRNISNIHKLIESITSLKNNKAGLITQRVNIKKLAEELSIKHKNLDSKTNEVSGMSEIVQYLKHVSVTPDQVNASDGGREVIEQSMGMTEEEIEAELMARLDNHVDENEDVVVEEVTNIDGKTETVEIPVDFDVDSLEDLEDDLPDLHETNLDPEDELDEFIETTEEEDNKVMISSSDDLQDGEYLVITRNGETLVIDENYTVIQSYDTSNVKVKLEKNEDNELIAIDVNGNYEIDIVDID